MNLYTLDSEGIKKLIDDMEKECAEIKHSALTLSWYMRGGVSYEDILNMSIAERDSIQKIIDDNLETTKTTKLPFF